jgi:tRNA dimethylallyltransferase
MLPEPFHNSLVLTGPTGCGKTALGVELAERLGAEIISMDSMALYRGMDIGTAKPDAAACQRVRHHLIDVLAPWESASVAWWLKKAAVTVGEIEQRGKRVLFVGGTPLYLKALLRGLFNGPPADKELRLRLAREAESNGQKALHHRLAQVDPRSAGRLHPNDVRRVIRALEVWELTGRPISAWQQQWSADCENTDSAIRNPVLWLDLPRTELYARIDARVQQMIDAGLVEEVRALRGSPRPLSREASQALGYKELFDYLEARSTLEEAITRIQVRSRNFAKRQLSWLRHLPECQPVSSELTFASWGSTMDGNAADPLFGGYGAH